MKKYINLKTYEINDSMEDYIPCDSEIADIIAILNRKGYKTIASCAGHNRVFDEEISSWPADKKDVLLRDKNIVYLVSEDEKEIKFVAKKLGIATYVTFDRDYNFSNIPEGFRLKKDSDISIVYLHSFYEDLEHKRRKSDETINKQLEDARKALLEWAMKLESIK